MTRARLSVLPPTSHVKQGRGIVSAHMCYANMYTNDIEPFVLCVLAASWHAGEDTWHFIRLTEKQAFVLFDKFNHNKKSVDII